MQDLGHKLFLTGSILLRFVKCLNSKLVYKASFGLRNFIKLSKNKIDFSLKFIY